MLEVLQEQENFRSAQQLYLDVRQKRQLRIGLTSVYRILRTLADDRIAETQRAEDGEILYRLRTGTGHRHYLVCRRCGAAERRLQACEGAAGPGGAALTTTSRSSHCTSRVCSLSGNLRSSCCRIGSAILGRPRPWASARAASS